MWSFHDFIILWVLLLLMIQICTAFSGNIFKLSKKTYSLAQNSLYLKWIRKTTQKITHYNSMLKKILSNKLLNTHILVWVIYVVYFSLLVKYFYNYALSYSFIVQTILHRVGEISLFYASAFWIFPKYLNLKKWLQLILTFTLVITLYLFYKIFVLILINNIFTMFLNFSNKN